MSMPGRIPATAELLEGAVGRALDFVGRSVGPGGAPSVELSLDAGFDQSLPGDEARGRLAETLGVDPGFDLGREAFTAMVSLMLLTAPSGGIGQDLAGRLAAQVEECRWRGRYRFLRGVGGLPADTDCTAMATGALHELGLLPEGGLKTGAGELVRAAATVLPQQPSRSDRDALRPGVFMVDWEDGQEPGRAQARSGCLRQRPLHPPFGRPADNDPGTPGAGRHDPLPDRLPDFGPLPARHPLLPLTRRAPVRGRSPVRTLPPQHCPEGRPVSVPPPSACWRARWKARCQSTDQVGHQDGSISSSA
jgi:hypothetical protein